MDNQSYKNISTKTGIPHSSLSRIINEESSNFLGTYIEKTKYKKPIQFKDEEIEYM